MSTVDEIGSWFDHRGDGRRRGCLYPRRSTCFGQQPVPEGSGVLGHRIVRENLKWSVIVAFSEGRSPGHFVPIFQSDISSQTLTFFVPRNMPIQIFLTQSDLSWVEPEHTDSEKKDEDEDGQKDKGERGRSSYAS